MTLSLTVIPACLPAAKGNDSLPWRHQPSHHRPRRATRLLCKAHANEARIGLYSCNKKRSPLFHAPFFRSFPA